MSAPPSPRALSVNSAAQNRSTPSFKPNGGLNMLETPLTDEEFVQNVRNSSKSDVSLLSEELTLKRNPKKYQYDILEEQGNEDVDDGNEVVQESRPCLENCV